MRDRHFPRICRSCQAPLARQEHACWRCGTDWAIEDEPRDQGPNINSRLRMHGDESFRPANGVGGRFLVRGPLRYGEHVFHELKGQKH